MNNLNNFDYCTTPHKLESLMNLLTNSQKIKDNIQNQIDTSLTNNNIKQEDKEKLTNDTYIKLLQETVKNYTLSNNIKNTNISNIDNNSYFNNINSQNFNQDTILSNKEDNNNKLTTNLNKEETVNTENRHKRNSNKNKESNIRENVDENNLNNIPTFNTLNSLMSNINNVTGTTYNNQHSLTKNLNKKPFFNDGKTLTTIKKSPIIPIDYFNNNNNKGTKEMNSNLTNCFDNFNSIKFNNDIINSNIIENYSPLIHSKTNTQTATTKLNSPFNNKIVSFPQQLSIKKPIVINENKDIIKNKKSGFQSMDIKILIRNAAIVEKEILEVKDKLDNMALYEKNKKNNIASEQDKQLEQAFQNEIQRGFTIVVNELKNNNDCLTKDNINMIKENEELKNYVEKLKMKVESINTELINERERNQYLENQILEIKANNKEDQKSLNHKNNFNSNINYSSILNKAICTNCGCKNIKFEDILDSFNNNKKHLAESNNKSNTLNPYILETFGKQSDRVNYKDDETIYLRNQTNSNEEIESIRNKKLNIKNYTHKQVQFNNNYNDSMNYSVNDQIDSQKNNDYSINPYTNTSAINNKLNQSNSIINPFVNNQNSNPNNSFLYKYNPSNNISCVNNKNKSTMDQQQNNTVSTHTTLNTTTKNFKPINCDTNVTVNEEISKEINFLISKSKYKEATLLWKTQSYLPLVCYSLNKSFDLLSLLFKLKDKDFNAYSKLNDSYIVLKNQNEIKEKEILHLMALVESLKEEINSLSSVIKERNEKMEYCDNALNEVKKIEKENIYLKYKIKQYEVFNMNNDIENYENNYEEEQIDD